jgi:hypothetical protein
VVHQWRMASWLTTIPRSASRSCTSRNRASLPAQVDYARALAKAVARASGGNFRVVERLFAQISRVLEIMR